MARACGSRRAGPRIAPDHHAPSFATSTSCACARIGAGLVADHHDPIVTVDRDCEPLVAVRRRAVVGPGGEPAEQRIVATHEHVELRLAVVNPSRDDEVRARVGRHAVGLRPRAGDLLVEPAEPATEAGASGADVAAVVVLDARDREEPRGIPRDRLAAPLDAGLADRAVRPLERALGVVLQPEHEIVAEVPVDADRVDVALVVDRDAVALVVAVGLVVHALPQQIELGIQSRGPHVVVAQHAGVAGDHHVAVAVDRDAVGRGAAARWLVGPRVDSTPSGS